MIKAGGVEGWEGGGAGLTESRGSGQGWVETRKDTVNLQAKATCTSSIRPYLSVVLAVDSCSYSFAQCHHCLEVELESVCGMWPCFEGNNTIYGHRR